MCSAVTQAAAGDDLAALRDKAFAAFRTQCRMKNEKTTKNPNEIKGKNFKMFPIEMSIHSMISKLTSSEHSSFWKVVHSPLRVLGRISSPSSSGLSLRRSE